MLELISVFEWQKQSWLQFRIKMFGHHSNGLTTIQYTSQRGIHPPSHALGDPAPRRWNPEGTIFFTLQDVAGLGLDWEETSQMVQNTTHLLWSLSTEKVSHCWVNLHSATSLFLVLAPQSVCDRMTRKEQAWPAALCAVCFFVQLNTPTK